MPYQPRLSLLAILWQRLAYHHDVCHIWSWQAAFRQLLYNIAVKGRPTLDLRFGWHTARRSDTKPFL